MANTKIGVSRTAIVLIDFIQSHPFVKFLFIELIIPHNYENFHYNKRGITEVTPHFV